MAPTLDALIQDLEDQRRSADRTLSTAKAALDRTAKRVKAEGRTHLTAEEDQMVTTLQRAISEAKARMPQLDRQLADARAVQAEEDQRALDEAVTHPTGAGRPSYDQVARVGTNDHLNVRTHADGGRRWIRTADRRPATVGRTERFADHEVVRSFADRQRGGDEAVIGQHGSLGMLVRSMTTTSGSAIVPTVWLGDIIDRARNLSAVLQAGAEIVPMDAKTVQIGRLTADPAAAFRSEGSTITATDPTFDNVTLDSKTMSALVVGSLEWFQDASNVDEVVSNAIAQAMATQLDLQALFGGVTTGGETGATAFNTTFPTPPNPRGVLATLLAVASSSVLGGAANGTTQTAASFWNEIIDTIYTPTDFNEAPNALLWPSKLARYYAKTYDTTNQPMRMPPVVEQIQKFVTNQIPASFTQGTSTANMTDVFAGDWTQLLIGQRLDVTVQTLTERYAENGQVGIVAHWRGDVGLARPRAFAVYRYLKNV